MLGWGKKRLRVQSLCTLNTGVGIVGILMSSKCQFSFSVDWLSLSVYQHDEYEYELEHDDWPTNKRLTNSQKFITHSWAWGS